MPAPQRMSTPHRMDEAHQPDMFPHTITIYNVSIETDKTTLKDTRTNHITILRGVLPQASKGVNVRESGLVGADAVNLIIPFDVVAIDGSDAGKKHPPRKRYVGPVEFWRMDDKTGLWTLSVSSKSSSEDGNTFFVKGEVVEPDRDVQYIEMMYDHVYNITKVDGKDYGSPDMQHWEVGGV